MKIRFFVLFHTRLVPILARWATVGKAWLLWFFFRSFHNELTTFNFLVVELADGLVGFVIIFHLNKTKTFGAAGSFVGDNADRLNLAIGFEKFAKAFFVVPEIQVSNKNVHNNFR